MKSILRSLTIIGLFTCLATNAGVAQTMPKAIPLSKAILDAAKKQFETAYAAEYGKPPAAATTAKAMKTFTLSVGGLAARLGTQAGEKAKRADNVRIGLDKLDGPALIDVLANMRSLNVSEMGFAKSKVVDLAEPDMPINQLDGRLLIKEPKEILKLKENTEIFFPAGNYALDERELDITLESAGKKFPKGVTFVGAGKDKTTLKITDTRFTSHDVDRLSFRDMTIDCDNDGLFDKRQGSLTLRLSGVRLVRFDAGHGGCRLFSINDGLVVHATDSEFVGGYGSSPGHGSIFDSNDVFLGYFERCEFSGIKYELFRSIRERSSMLWMDGCKFDRVSRANNGVILTGCAFDFKPPALDWAPADEE